MKASPLTNDEMSGVSGVPNSNFWKLVTSEEEGGEEEEAAAVTVFTAVVDVRGWFVVVRGGDEMSLRSILPRDPMPLEVTRDSAIECVTMVMKKSTVMLIFIVYVLCSLCLFGAVGAVVLLKVAVYYQ